MEEEFGKEALTPMFEKHLLNLIHESPESFWDQRLDFEEYTQHDLIEDLTLFYSLKCHRLGASPINYETLIEVLKQPAWELELIFRLIEEFKAESDKTLEVQEKQFLALKSVSQRIDLHLQYIKEDIEFIRRIQEKQRERKFIENADISVCVTKGDSECFFKITERDH